MGVTRTNVIKGAIVSALLVIAVGALVYDSAPMRAMRAVGHVADAVVDFKENVNTSTMLGNAKTQSVDVKEEIVEVVKGVGEAVDAAKEKIGSIDIKEIDIKFLKK